MNESAIMTDRVFENIAGLKRMDVVMEPDQLLPDDKQVRLQNGLNDLLSHKPVQYITGEAWFYNLRFIVNESVLIPRPETEELVQMVIDHVKAGNQPNVKILDIGTGSGCIPIAIKKTLPETNITAIDFSEGALIVAKENATLHETVVDFIQLDFTDANNWQQLPMFNIIVSNPPYIPFKEKSGLDKTVTEFEPGSALFVPDERPLLFYELIAEFGASHLLPGGMIVVETHENLAQETAAVFKEKFSAVTVHKDVFGKERMVSVSHSR